MPVCIFFYSQSSSHLAKSSPLSLSVRMYIGTSLSVLSSTLSAVLTFTPRNHRPLLNFLRSGLPYQGLFCIDDLSNVCQAVRIPVPPVDFPRVYLFFCYTSFVVLSRACRVLANSKR